jgi:hypothetical protein
VKKSSNRRVTADTALTGSMVCSGASRGAPEDVPEDVLEGVLAAVAPAAVVTAATLTTAFGYWLTG